MVNETVKLVRADWDLRPKTKFLTVEGYVTVESPNDEVTAEIAIPPGTNPGILLIRVTVKPSNGPKKPQPAPFYLREMVSELDQWTHVQVEFGGESDNMPITILDWAGISELVVTPKNDQELQKSVDTAVLKSLKAMSFDTGGAEFLRERVTGFERSAVDDRRKVKVTVKFTPDAHYWVQIEETDLSFVNGESQEVDLKKENSPYALVYFVRGNPGTTGEIKVFDSEKPDEIKSVNEEVIKPGKSKGMGIIYFDIK